MADPFTPIDFTAARGTGQRVLQVLGRGVPLAGPAAYAARLATAQDWIPATMTSRWFKTIPQISMDHRLLSGTFLMHTFLVNVALLMHVAFLDDRALLSHRAFLDHRALLGRASFLGDPGMICRDGTVERTAPGQTTGRS